MNKIKNVIKYLLLIGLIGLFGNSNAALVDHFQVTMSPNKAKVGETIDITIEAVDINNNIITDYKSAILVFSESDPEADFPTVLKENSYTFKASDEGKVKFENAVRFQAIGLQDIYVYELENDTILGTAEVEISGEEAGNNVDIEILSPENGITIGKSKIVISGKTNKNYSVIINVNNGNEIQTTSNGEGIFEEEISGLKKGNNTIFTQILNSDGEVIGTSPEINIRIESDKPRIRNIKINPEGDLEPEQKFELEVISNVGLSEVSVIINDVLITLTEKSQGIYNANSNAPKDEGSYSVDIILKDEIGNETKELGVETITVKKIEVEVLEVEEEKPKPEIVEIIKEEVCSKDIKITGLKLTKLKTKSILNWDSIKNISKYNVYKKLSNGGNELVKSVNKPVFTIDIVGDEIKYELFAIKAVCIGDEKEFEGTISDATRIQIGPREIILLIVSLLLGGLLMFYRKKA